MNEREFVGELTHLIWIALAITFFVIFFLTMLKIAVSKIPNPGIQALFASL